MALVYFYGSITVIIIAFSIFVLKKTITFKHIIIYISGIGYSLLYETVFGEYAGLYHYINKSDSLFYIIVSGVLLYPVIDAIYALFLPEKVKPTILYTIIWLALMISSELLSLYTKTIVFTGWKLLPWSIVTYVFTFIWINLLFRYMKKRGL